MSILSFNNISTTNPLWDGLLAYYNGDNTPNDAVGSNNGVLTNGVTYGTGIINNGFSFDGVNDYVRISPSLGNSFSAPGSPHSYSAWVNPTALVGYKWVLQVGGSNSIGTSMILINGNLGFFYRGGTSVTINTSVTLSTNTFSHIVCSYNGTGSVSFYVNGSFLGTGAASWTQGSGTVFSNIGTHSTGMFFFNGVIDEAAFFSKALSSSEVTELYNSGVGKQYPN